MSQGVSSGNRENREKRGAECGMGTRRFMRFTLDEDLGRLGKMACVRAADLLNAECGMRSDGMSGIM